MKKIALAFLKIGINMLVYSSSFALVDSANLGPQNDVARTQQCTTIYVNPYKTSNFSCSNIYYAPSCNSGDVVTGVYSYGSPFFRNQCQLLCETPQKICSWQNV